jgi:proline iminopeptidase
MTDRDPLAPGTHTITIEGVRQRYIVAGSGPVCIAHSGGPGVNWDYLRMPAVEEFATMVYVEPAGTAHDNRLASHPHGYTVDTYTSFMRGVIDHLAVPEAYILGHSFGGLIAASFALTEPERVSGLILYASEVTNGPEFDYEADLNFEMFIVDHSDAPGIDKYADALHSDPGPDDVAQTEQLHGILPAYFADYYGREDEFGGMLDGIRVSAVESDEFTLRGSLEKLRVPTLVLAGRHDPVCGPRWAAELNEGIPESRLVMFEQSGHMPHVEQSAPFAEALADFLRERST